VSAFEDLKRNWLEAKLHQTSKPKAIMFEHRVPAKTLLTELATLTVATLDLRFRDAGLAIAENNLLNAGGDWKSKFQPVYDWNTFWEPFAINTIDYYLKKNYSQRIAVAKTAVLCQWEGNSFEAANKDLDRLWRRFVKSQDVVPSLDKICEVNEERIELFMYLAGGYREPNEPDANFSGFLRTVQSWRELMETVRDLRWLESIEL
jgi:hypothetical protein